MPMPNIQNAQQRYLSPDAVKNPDTLHRFLMELTNNFNRLQATMVGMGGQMDGMMANGNLNSNSYQQSQIRTAKQDQNVLSGVSSGAAALVELGIDPMATAKNNLNANGAPTANDDISQGWSLGSFWVDQTGPKVYLLTDPTISAAVWTLLN